MNFDDMINLVESNLDSQNVFYSAVGEYVGANMPLNIDKWSTQLSPYVKSRTCYRMWELDSNKFKMLEQDNSIPIKPAPYYACSKYVESIKQMMADDGGFQNVVISKHVGRSIDMMELLRDCIKNTSDFELKKYLTNVYRANQHQNEILFLDRIQELNSSNIVGMSESGNPDEIN